jgi:transposase
MRRRKFGREFKLEAVNLVRERGVSATQAARDPDVHMNVLRAADLAGIARGHRYSAIRAARRLTSSTQSPDGRR